MSNNQMQQATTAKMSDDQQEGPKSYSTSEVSYFIQSLQQNYQQRIEELQRETSELFSRLENDDVLEAMRNDKDMEKFRLERLKEIVQEAFKTEKENYIDMMIEQNAMLRLDCQKAEEEKMSLAESAREEIAAMTRRMCEFESKWQQEEAIKCQLAGEVQKLSKKAEIEKSEFDEIMKLKNSSKSQQDVFFRNELQVSRAEVEELLRERSALSIEMEQQKEEIAHLRKASEVFSMRQMSRSESEKGLEQKIDELKGVIGKLQLHINQLGQDNKSSAEVIQQKERELSNAQLTVDEINKENNELSEEIERLRIAAAKAETAIEERTSEISKKLEKVRGKKKSLKIKLAEIKEITERTAKEQEMLKKQLFEQKDSYEKRIVSMRGDMQKIKEEWEERCAELEHEFQQQLAETKQRHSAQIQKIQGEYQKLLDKQVNDQLEESNGRIPQLPRTIQQLEREYIKKELHHQTLLEELSKVQQRNQDMLNQLEDRHSLAISAKIREVNDRKNKEYESLIQNVQQNFEDVQSKLEEQIQVNQGDKNKILELENAVFKLKDANHSQTQIISELKEKEKVSLSSAQLRSEELERAISEQREIQRQLDDQIELNDQLQEEIEKLEAQIALSTEQARQNLEDIDELSRNLESIQDERDSLARQLEQERLKLEKEKKAASRQASFAENIKLTQEKEEHDQTREKVSQLEKKLRIETSELEKLRQELSQEQQKHGEEFSRLRTQKEKIESDKKELILQNSELKHRIELWGEKLRIEKQRICKKLCLQLKSLRGDLDDIKGECIDEIMKTQEITVSMIVRRFEETEINRKELHVNVEQKLLEKERNHEQVMAQKERDIEQGNMELQELQRNLEKERAKVEELTANLNQAASQNQQQASIFNSQISKLQQEQAHIVAKAVETALATAQEQIQQLSTQLASQQSSGQSLCSETLQETNGVKGYKNKLEEQSTRSIFTGEFAADETNALKEEIKRKDGLVEQLRDQLGKLQIQFIQVQQENVEDLNRLEERLETYHAQDSSNKQLQQHQIDWRNKRVNSDGGVERESAHFPPESDNEINLSNQSADTLKRLREAQTEHWKEQLKIQQQLQLKRFSHHHSQPSMRQSKVNNNQLFYEDDENNSEEQQHQQQQYPLDQSEFSTNQYKENRINSCNNNNDSSYQSPDNLSQSMLTWTLQQPQSQQLQQHLLNYHNSTTMAKDKNSFYLESSVKETNQKLEKDDDLFKKHMPSFNLSGSFAVQQGNHNNEHQQISPQKVELLKQLISISNPHKVIPKQKQFSQLMMPQQEQFYQQSQQYLPCSDAILRQKSAALIAASAALTSRQKVDFNASISSISHLQNNTQRLQNSSNKTQSSISQHSSRISKVDPSEQKNITSNICSTTRQPVLSSANTEKKNTPQSNIQNMQNLIKVSNKGILSWDVHSISSARNLTQEQQKQSQSPNSSQISYSRNQLFSNENKSKSAKPSLLLSTNSNFKKDGELLQELNHLLAQSHSLVKKSETHKSSSSSITQQSASPRDLRDDYIFKKSAATTRRTTQGKTLSQQILSKRTYDINSPEVDQPGPKIPSQSSYLSSKQLSESPFFSEKNYQQTSIKARKQLTDRQIELKY